MTTDTVFMLKHAPTCPVAQPRCPMPKPGEPSRCICDFIHRLHQFLTAERPERKP